MTNNPKNNDTKSYKFNFITVYLFKKDEKYIFTYVILSLAKLKLGLLAHVTASVEHPIFYNDKPYKFRFVFEKRFNLELSQFPYSLACILTPQTEGLPDC